MIRKEGAQKVVNGSLWGFSFESSLHRLRNITFLLQEKNQVYIECILFLFGEKLASTVSISWPQLLS